MLDKYGRMAWAFASPKTILEYDIYQIYTKYIPNISTWDCSIIPGKGWTQSSRSVPRYASLSGARHWTCQLKTLGNRFRLFLVLTIQWLGTQFWPPYGNMQWRNFGHALTSLYLFPIFVYKHSYRKCLQLSTRLIGGTNGPTQLTKIVHLRIQLSNYFLGSIISNHIQPICQACPECIWVYQSSIPLAGW